MIRRSQSCDAQRGEHPAKGTNSAKFLWFKGPQESMYELDLIENDTK